MRGVLRQLLLEMFYSEERFVLICLTSLHGWCELDVYTCFQCNETYYLLNPYPVHRMPLYFWIKWERWSNYENFCNLQRLLRLSVSDLYVFISVSDLYVFISVSDLYVFISVSDLYIFISASHLYVFISVSRLYVFISASDLYVFISVSRLYVFITASDGCRSYAFTTVADPTYSLTGGLGGRSAPKWSRTMDPTQFCYVNATRAMNPKDS